MPHTYLLITERPLGSRESRVCRSEVRLRDASDYYAVRDALASGRLKPRPGVRAWVMGRTCDAS